MATSPDNRAHEGRNASVNGYSQRRHSSGYRRRGPYPLSGRPVVWPGQSRSDDAGVSSGRAMVCGTTHAPDRRETCATTHAFRQHGHGLWGQYDRAPQRIEFREYTPAFVQRRPRVADGLRVLRAAPAAIRPTGMHFALQQHHPGRGASVDEPYSRTGEVPRGAHCAERSSRVSPLSWPANGLGTR